MTENIYEKCILPLSEENEDHTGLREVSIFSQTIKKNQNCCGVYSKRVILFIKLNFDTLRTKKTY